MADVKSAVFYVESVVSIDSQKLSEDKNYRKKYNSIQLQAKFQADVTILNKSRIRPWVPHALFREVNSLWTDM